MTTAVKYRAQLVLMLSNAMFNSYCRSRYEIICNIKVQKAVVAFHKSTAAGFCEAAKVNTAYLYVMLLCHC
jgi:hypothetical protein